MDATVLQLIKIISALYYNAMCVDKITKLNGEAKAILETIEVNHRAGISVGGIESTIENLRDTCEMMLSNGDEPFDKGNLVQRLSANLQCNNDYVGIALSGLEENIEEAVAKKKVLEILRELKYDGRKSKAKKLISKANAKLNFTGEYVETDDFLKWIMEELNELHSSKDNSGLLGLVSKVNFNNDDELRTVLEKGLDSLRFDGLLKTGIKGLDRFLEGGFVRGYLAYISALSFHYKTGSFIDLALNMPVINEPWMWDSTKKPLMLFITYENTTSQNAVAMYERIYSRKWYKENKEKFDSASEDEKRALSEKLKQYLKTVDLDTVHKAIQEHYKSAKYSFEMLHFNPSMVTIHDLIGTIDGFIQDGYEIHCVTVDYLALLQESKHTEKLDMSIPNDAQMLRNYCNPKGIAVITGHQLSSDAQNILGGLDGSTGTFTRKVSERTGCYKQCRSLHQKMDTEIFAHIVNHYDGYSYLSLSRAKHRIIGDTTPESVRHFFKRFDLIGGLNPDYESDELVLYKLPKSIDPTESVVNWE